MMDITYRPPIVREGLELITFMIKGKVSFTDTYKPFLLYIFLIVTFPRNIQTSSVPDTWKWSLDKFCSFQYNLKLL